MNSYSRENPPKVMLGIGALFLVMCVPLKYTPYASSAGEALMLYGLFAASIGVSAYVGIPWVFRLGIRYMLGLREVHMTIATIAAIPLICILSYFYYFEHTNKAFGQVLVDFTSMVYAIIGSVSISTAISYTYRPAKKNK